MKKLVPRLQALGFLSCKQVQIPADVTHLPPSFPTMLKRGSSESNHNKRKRKKNGISSSTVLLGCPVGTPLSKPKKSLRAWHTNVEDPFTIRRSAVPIPRGFQDQGAEVSEAGGEDFVATVPVVKSAPKKPKRKRGNDSVSHNTSGSKSVVDFVINFLL